MRALEFVKRRLPRPIQRRRFLQRWSAVDGGGDPHSLRPGEDFPFRCNLCGTCNQTTLALLTREDPSCVGCGSNVRFRTMALLVAREVTGEAMALPDLPVRRELTGLGLSDAAAYADPLAEKFTYENTWYHKAPRLDIANIDDAWVGRLDFLVASDVFEHVEPPVARAFANARRLLKPGGKLIFSVPFSLEDETREHYPELHAWSMAERDGCWTLDNRTRDGRAQKFDNLVFHGGPGSTLEMRLFSRAALEREFTAAGFTRVRVASEPWLPFGIHWPDPWSVPMVAYA